MKKVHFRDFTNQQSDHNTKGLTKKHNESKNTTIFWFTNKTLFRSVESEKMHKFNFIQQYTGYHTPFNY